MAKNAGIRIYPVSLGTPNGKVTFGFGAFTNSVPVPPDPVTMGQIAAVTGGKAYTAQTSSSVVQIYKTLGSSIGRTHKRVDVAAWFAGIAAGFLAAAVGASLLAREPDPVAVRPCSVAPVIHLSLVAGGELWSEDGGQLGRVDDLIVRLGEDEYPPVTGLLATVAGRQVFVPADAVAEIEEGRDDAPRSAARSPPVRAPRRRRCC